MKPTTALMYHALYGSEREYGNLESDERPYALSGSTFAEQIDSLVRSGISVANPADVESLMGIERAVLITFDDGHSSNASIAMDLLCERRVNAIFFLTAGHIGIRGSSCTWAQVRQMHQAGMAIGAHGYTHRFISELGIEEARDELRNSKVEIEQRLGVAVDQMSFPGGMYGPRDIALAGDAGYRACYTSDIPVRDLSVATSPLVVPRFAVRHGDEATRVLAWVGQDPISVGRLRFSSWAKRLVRRILGAGLYHKAYQLRAGKH